MHTEKLPQNELHRGSVARQRELLSLSLCLSLCFTLMHSLTRASPRFLFVLQQPCHGCIEYRGICKFWVELGQLTRAPSNQRFWGGRGWGKNGLAVLFFFFYIDTSFFFHVESGQKRDTWNLPLVVCISSTVTLCDHEIYLGYKIHGNVFVFFFFLEACSTIYSFNVTRDGER